MSLDGAADVPRAASRKRPEPRASPSRRSRGDARRRQPRSRAAPRPETSAARVRYNAGVRFEIHARADGSRARAATLTTPHGEVETPVFMPVGTRGTVRTQTLGQLERLGAPMLLANTYHLRVRPGPEVLDQVGGLHAWMGWRGALLTDSGGFQLFSLAHARTVTEDGAEFRITPDGPRLRLTPEDSIETQRAIGSDIMMVLDHCIDARSPHAEARAAMELTHRWARRCLAARGDRDQAMFAIVQGACFEDLRRISAAELTALPGFAGYAIGGLAVGEPRAQREDMTELTCGLLPDDRPRYLMGVGTPLDLLEGVHRGVDMFDCILPTALAQQGLAFTSHGRIDLRRGVHKVATRPLDDACPCEACVRYPRSYLHHLVKCKEPLGWQLLAFHNLRFYVELMAEIRGALRAGTFGALLATRRDTLGRVDPDNPPGRAPRVRPARPLSRGAFAIHDAPAGFASVRHVASGELMHSVNRPDDEAERVYVAASVGIADAAAARRGRPLVVWDVGLGAAHNAMALIRRLDAAPGHDPVELVSFEHDLDALRLALDHLKRFPHLRHEAPHRLGRDGEFARDGLRWRRCDGDFLSGFERQPPPDVIFYDPWSAKVDGAMWSLATFRRLFAHLVGPTELFTYSASTAVRSALLAAGFHVARGVASGPKEETTIALRPGDGVDFSRHPLLDHAWLARRARSTARFGADVAADQHAAVEAAIVGHAQFA
ncbi:MAG: tRNA guanosine(34) transglycosylase Tgt [Kofleriaceae bacterium]|nr:tRNA guanosine(34) transglycosylase Tgt [Kofleriaceae bacterium]